MRGTILYDVKSPLLISTKKIWVVILLVCLQVRNNFVSASANSTIKLTQLSTTEDFEKQSNGFPNDVSLRRNLPRCGGIYTVRPGDLAFRVYSPDYPLPYPSLLNCIYDIRFKGGSFPCAVDLGFEDFFLNSEPPDCYGDKLEIGRQRFCGGLSGVERFETEWTSNGERHLLLRFVTDEVGTGRGFKICVSQVPCVGPLPIPPIYSPSPPVFPPPFQPPTFIPPPYTPPPYTPPPYTPPPYNPPFLPPYNPPSIPPRPNPPFYPPPLLPPWGPLPLCCGTQYQGRRVHLVSPGFPSQLPVGGQCAYVINRINPRVTQLRVHLKYFFLPCPWVPLKSQSGVSYPPSSRGYFNVDNRNICGCQTGLTITIPFGWFETRKVLRLYSQPFIPLSRSQEGNELKLEIRNESSLTSDRKTSFTIKPSPHDYGWIDKSENLQLVKEDVLVDSKPVNDFGKSPLVVFPSSSLADRMNSYVKVDMQRWVGKNFSDEEMNSTSDTLSKSGRAFNPLVNNRRLIWPPLGFLLEVVQEEIAYIPGKRRNGLSRAEDINDPVSKAKSAALSVPSSQNASSRFFHIPARTCGVNDWPLVNWCLLWLRKKNLLQTCPIRVPPIPQPPFIQPPLCDEPFIPVYR